MNRDKLKNMQTQRMGGKGTPRRKKKAVHKTTATDDKKLQSTMKKLAVNPIPGIEEVNMFREDGSVLHFNNPKVQASVGSNTYVVSGNAEEKQLPDLLPGIINQLGPDNLENLKKIAETYAQKEGAGAPAPNDDDVPPLVSNFEAASEGK